MSKVKIDINKKWCKACNVCIDFCPKSVLYLDENNKVEVKNIDDCTGCMMCEYRCPDYVIKVEVNK